MSKFLTGTLLVSGTSTLGSSVPVISKSRETIVVESQQKFSKQQDRKRRRSRKLKRKLGIGVRFDSRRRKGKEGGFSVVEVSGISQNSGYNKEREPYTPKQQQEARDKVFEHQKKMIIEKYKKPENVWWSPDRELNEFEVSNDAVTLLISTKFTDSEKLDVKNQLKRYWCGATEKWTKLLIVKETEISGVLFDAIRPPGEIYNIFSWRRPFYFWWLEYCMGRQSRYPNWSDGTWPEVSITLLLEEYLKLSK